MSLVSLVVLLQTALTLLSLVNANPSLPQSTRDYASQVAQQAITQATATLALQAAVPNAALSASVATASQPIASTTYSTTVAPTMSQTTSVSATTAARTAFTWSYIGPVAGKQCTKMDEGSDAAYWQDNYLCTDVEIGMRWSSYGTVSGMTCANIYDPAVSTALHDPWADNYLCLPTDSPYTFTWSYGGQIAGKQCTRVNEPSASPAWQNTYLCIDFDPTACHLDGKTIANGGTVTAYQSALVPAGQSCVSQMRTCTNGILNGSYPRALCSDASGAFNGAVGNLFGHYWTGSKSTGYITPTWSGIVGEYLADQRGITWPASSFLSVLFTRYVLNPTEANLQPIRAEWNHRSSQYSDSEFTSCGNGATVSPWLDDLGWNAAMFLEFYEATHDDHALYIARAAVQCGFSRWRDLQFGGGLWYNDDKNIKSLYTIGLTLDAFRIYELTHDTTFLAESKESYDWMQTMLLRSDNIYWMDYGWWAVPWDMEDHTTVAPHILGSDQPNNIHVGGSVSSLAGTMGMDVMHARMYRLTGDAAYKQRAIDVARGILTKFVGSDGIFIDDRDGWTNGAFVRQWVIEVYPLLPADLQQSASDAFKNTAIAIETLDITPDRYYGPNWGGPANAVWGNNTKAQQIMTSTQAVDFLAGPALIEAHLPVPVTPPVPKGPAVSSLWLGQTGEDFVGEENAAPDGVKDEHIRLTGVSSPITSVAIYGTTGAWSYPARSGIWTVAVKPQSDSTVVDLYFDHYKDFSSYTVELTFANGQTAHVTASAPQIAATLLGQTGEDYVGQLTSTPDGVKDVHILLTGVVSPIQKLKIDGAQGTWIYPADNKNWTVVFRPQSNPTVVDVYIDFYKQFSSYALTATFANGTTATVTAQ